MDLSQTMLSAGDLKSISEAVHSNKIPELRSLVISGNILTNSLHELIGENEYYGFLSLQVLDLTNTVLLERDLACLFGTLRYGQWPKLKELKLQPSTLVGCLDDFVNSPVHRNRLSLKNAGLREADVGILRTAVERNSRLRRLKLLDLSENVLTGFLDNLIEGLQMLHRFPQLEIFDLTNTRLSEQDLSYLASEVTPNTFPKLGLLNLSKNNLENCMKDFRSAKLPSLKVLLLESTHLTKDDITNLSAMLHNNATILEMLDLSDNILTNSVEKKSLKILCAICMLTFVLAKTPSVPFGFQASNMCFKVLIQCLKV